MGARLAIEALLSTLPTSAPGAPPQSIFFLRKLALPVPTSALASAPDAGARQRFAVAAAHALQEALRDAVWPARERARADAVAVLFADEAELLACLIRDAARAELDHWWWRVVLLGRYPDWATELTRRAHALPGALRMLKRAGLLHALAPFIRAHAPGTAAMLLPLTVTAALGGDEQKVKAHEPAVLNVRPGAERVPPLIENVRVGRSPQRERVRSPSTEASSRGQPERMAVVVADDPAPMPPAERAQYRSHRPERSPVAVATLLTGSLPLESEHGGEALVPHSAARGDVSLASAPSGELERPARAMEHSQWPAPADVAASDGSYGAHVAAEQLAQAIPDLTPSTFRDQRCADAAPAPQPPWECAAESGSYAPSVQAALEHALPALALDPTSTRYGGIFYLVNVFLAQGMYPDFTRPAEAGFPIPLWRLLQLASERLLGARFRRDPLHSLLARLADEATVAESPVGDLNELWAPPSTISTGRHADATARWVDGFARWLRRELSAALGYPPLQVARRLACTDARVWLTPSEIVAAYSLDAHDVRIRLAGLDRNPGFLPSAGYSLRFTYE